MGAIISTVISFFSKKQNLNLLLIVILAAASFICGYKSHKCKCPEIKSGITLIDTIIVHDTITSIITDVKERIKPVINYVKVYDTISNTTTIVTVIDTAICYKIEDTIAGAYLGAEICSKAFTFKKPLDLTGSFTYLPAPDTQKIRIDTVTYSKPFFKEPRNYIIAGLVGIVGFSTYQYFKK